MSFSKCLSAFGLIALTACAEGPAGNSAADVTVVLDGQSHPHWTARALAPSVIEGLPPATVEPTALVQTASGGASLVVNATATPGSWDYSLRLRADWSTLPAGGLTSLTGTAPSASVALRMVATTAQAGQRNWSLTAAPQTAQVILDRVSTTPSGLRLEGRFSATLCPDQTAPDPLAPCKIVTGSFDSLTSTPVSTPATPGEMVVL